MRKFENKKNRENIKKNIKARAELGQAQLKLGLDSPLYEY